MKAKFCQTLERGRDRLGHYASATGDRFGRFRVHRAGVLLLMVASDGADLPAGQAVWEHVSVTAWPDGAAGPSRLPSYAEMLHAAGLFWAPEEWVVQFRPAASEYVDCHPHCLHWWRHAGGFPTPPSWMVGPKAVRS